MPRFPRPLAGVFRRSGSASQPRAQAAASARSYTATVLLNVTSGPRGQYLNFFGYQHGQPLARAEILGDGPLVLTVEASTVEAAADHVYLIGNSAGADSFNRSWPSGVRALSVGDVLHITGSDGREVHLAVASDGYERVDAPTNIVPLAGSTAITHV
ncbi:hypothetical protein PUR61_38665 [Streptomyces sp. BE20]|uniref:hypothetical protein n=1 Tax=Streptomyces sp. BE20 TaxID=3002525 RepID=UPI002E78A18C|nr:hypothetical protein [Streptomyces sp. BE20]MEE1828060.1 hypothetical protein [Streptomyces sp. BE20]